MLKVAFLLFCFLGNIFFAQVNDNLELCGDKKVYPYYYLQNSGNYIPDFYQIKGVFNTKYFKEEYSHLENNTGILHITFWVNCKGETGNYSMESFNFDYQYCVLNDKIKQRILELVQSLKIWKPIAEDQLIQNFHQYYIFKIKNGEITDILPK
ncbi:MULTISPECIES: hypothetical protein [Epilithonimonas]|uniref:hypothetical protein n=1 Tax=Epilithonimonas TaxID=2782229 RepID=UPI0028A13D70|nr:MULTISPECIES: hypothetical protein [Epilithonimonas]